MIQKRVQVELQLIAKKYNKPYNVIEEIYLSQFRMTADVMRTINFDTIKLPSWGKYIASENKMIKFKEKLLRNHEKYGTTRVDKDSSLQGNE